ncbi:low-complexity tail membrane protein [Leptothermofonsia sp. ETS-13]|uniref:low-complexity tail membrane protein n=1 Tax=Leptothermofonsia sp. ETS-13 TaxID=3035696 RepID=UPI003B9DDE43
MRSFWSDPYLWIHLAGLAAVPIFLELCLLGFAVGDPVLPVWLELFLVSAIGIVPILWMQWQRPFYIFSLVAVALKPERLTDDQRRLLTLFKSQRNQILAGVVSIPLIFVLHQVYQIAPIATPVAHFPTEWRFLGLMLAGVAFLAANLFTQVPVSVLGVMLHSDAVFAATDPYPLEQIGSSFSLVGIKVAQILPPIVLETPPAPVVASSVTVVETSTQELETSNQELIDTIGPELVKTEEPVVDLAYAKEVNHSETSIQTSKQNLPESDSETSSNGNSTSSEVSSEEDVWDL